MAGIGQMAFKMAGQEKRDRALKVLKAVMLSHPDLVEKIYLTDQVRTAVMLVRRYGKPMQPRTLAAEMDISHQHASRLLSDAMRKGYLTRQLIDMPVGRAEWGYTYGSD